METLAHLVDHEVRLDCCLVRASRSSPQISNFSFVDNLIPFGEAIVKLHQVIHSCLDKFCITSGSNVSFHKSRVLFSTNIDFEMRDAIYTEHLIGATEYFRGYLRVRTIKS